MAARPHWPNEIAPRLSSVLKSVRGWLQRMLFAHGSFDARRSCSGNDGALSQTLWPSSVFWAHNMATSHTIVRNRLGQLRAQLSETPELLRRLSPELRFGATGARRRLMHGSTRADDVPMLGK